MPETCSTDAISSFAAMKKKKKTNVRRKGTITKANGQWKCIKQFLQQQQWLRCGLGERNHVIEHTKSEMQFACNLPFYL